MMSRIINNILFIVSCILLNYACSPVGKINFNPEGFSIDTTYSHEGEIKSVRTNFLDTPYGPWIEYNQELCDLNFSTYGINDIQICCYFNGDRLRFINYRINENNSIGIGLFGDNYQLSSSDVNISGESKTFNYDFRNSGKLLSIIEKSRDSIAILLDRGDDFLHMTMSAQEMAGDNKTDVETTYTEIELLHNGYCRVDTIFYSGGMIKSMSQMAGHKRNGAFVKLDRSGRVREVATFLLGKPEGPRFSFYRNGSPKIAGYKSGSSWIGAVVLFHKKRVPKKVISKTRTSTIICKYDDKGEYLCTKSISQKRNMNIKDLRWYFLKQVGHTSAKENKE
jgi:antitoxin component YwqK of YwqJK toxin-antitoxin module